MDRNTRDGLQAAAIVTAFWFIACFIPLPF